MVAEPLQQVDAGLRRAARMLDSSPEALLRDSGGRSGSPMPSVRVTTPGGRTPASAGTSRSANAEPPEATVRRCSY